ncbi:hypothetical protein V6N11_007828 [Hibiscus sabdariffa]|uniref:Uncharacterized protein n=1 Tax=Hibiscus sabdariffa TaxID=183260 RepID=A0ABR2PZC1_9ROSI
MRRPSSLRTIVRSRLYSAKDWTRFENYIEIRLSTSEIAGWESITVYEGMANGGIGPGTTEPPYPMDHYPTA